MLELGRKLLEKVYNKSGEVTVQNAELDGCNYRDYGLQTKKVLTLLGSIEIRRRYYYDPITRTGKIPFDEMMGIGMSSYSPGVQRAVSRTGAFLAFEVAEKHIRELTGISVDAKTVERITKSLGAEVCTYNNTEENKRMPDTGALDKETLYLCMDGTGIPMNREALAGRKGKRTEEARTREVKLGCIFTQIGQTAEGYPLRQTASTTYFGGIETAEEFGKQVEAAAKERKAAEAKRRCILGDGAAWIWNIADDYFPDAIQIVDLFHAREHYWEVAKMFFESDSKEMHAWTDRRKRELDEGAVTKVIAAMKRLTPKRDEQKQMVDRAIGYFEKHRERMRYKLFREKNLFVGSGVLEAGCRSVIGQRLKQSGMHWSLKGAEAMVALRCCIYSDQWEDFWEKRAA